MCHMSRYKWAIKDCWVESLGNKLAQWIFSEWSVADVSILLKIFGSISSRGLRVLFGGKRQQIT